MLSFTLSFGATLQVTPCINQTLLAPPSLRQLSSDWLPLVNKKSDSYSCVSEMSISVTSYKGKNRKKKKQDVKLWSRNSTCMPESNEENNMSSLKVFWLENTWVGEMEKMKDCINTYSEFF